MSPIDYVWETVKYAGITDVDTQRAINILEDNDMRVLKGWTKDEREELEDAEVNGFHNAIGLIHEAIFGDAYKSEYIYNKYCNCTSNKEDNQLIKDIADYYTGDAKFPEQKYRLTLPDGNYLARGMSGEDLKQAVDYMITPTQHNCPYCHYPCKTFRNGDRLIPPTRDSDWWGLMPHYQENKIGTIIKIYKCPECGRKLGANE